MPYSMAALTLQPPTAGLPQSAHHLSKDLCAPFAGKTGAKICFLMNYKPAIRLIYGGCLIMNGVKNSRKSGVLSYLNFSTQDFDFRLKTDMNKTFFCIDAHTCGNPVRLVAGGGPN